MLKIFTNNVLRVLFLITLLASFFLTAPEIAFAQSPGLTTVFLVRHAEKSSPTGDPSLSPAGKKRAEELVHVLSEANIEAIYSTEFKRTQETAKPLADFLGLNVITTNDLAQKVANHTGKRLLLVSHSGPFGVEGIINELNGNPRDCSIDSDYDNLCLVIIDGSGATEVINLHYGDPSPNFP